MCSFARKNLFSFVGNLDHLPEMVISTTVFDFDVQLLFVSAMLQQRGAAGWAPII